MVEKGGLASQMHLRRDGTKTGLGCGNVFSLVRSSHVRVPRLQLLRGRPHMCLGQ